MRNRRRRGLAVALVGTATAGVIAISASSAFAGAWFDTGENFQYEALCEYAGQQDVNAGTVLNYNCQFQAVTLPDGADTYVWELYEFAE